MKKTLLKMMPLICCLILIPGIFSGCTVKKDDPNVITILVDNKDTDIFRQIFKEFEEQYIDKGWKVNPIWTPGGTIQDDQASKIGGGAAPDIIIGGDMYTETYRRSLIDLKTYIERDADEVDIDDILPGIMDNLVTSDNKTIFMPRFFNLSLLYYNKKLFDASKAALLEAGITAPPAQTPEEQRHYPHIDWTIEDYFKAGAVLTKRNGDDVTQWGSSLVGGWWGEWLIHLRQSGGDLYNSDGRITFNTQAGKLAMQIYRDKMYGNAELGRSQISVQPGQADLAGFQAQKTAMDYGGHTANWPRFDTISGLEWEVCPLPTGLARRGGAEYAVEGYGIHSSCKNIEAAWALIKFMTNKDGIDNFVDNGYIPIRQSVYDEMAEGARKKRCKLVMDLINPDGPYGAYAMTLPKYETFAAVATEIVQAEIDKMVAKNNPQSIEKTVEEIEKKANDYIDLYG
jgi:ABC-type glycerol-3-phosphate transport system substrate-binding protein